MFERLTLILDADINRLDAALNQASGRLERFGGIATRIGTTLSVALSAPIALFTKKAVEAYAEMDSLERGLATVEKNAASLSARLKELLIVAKLPGLGYKEAIQFDVALRSAGFSAELSKRSMMAFGNALANIGKGKNELKGVSVQLQQLSTKQGGFGADLRIIKEYAPQVGAALQKAFGTVDTEKIAKMGVNGTQVIERIVAELEKLPKATGGPANAMENFGDITFRSFARVGQAIDKAAGISGIIDKISNIILGLTDRFTTLSPTIQKVFFGLAAGAVIIPPLLAVLGTLSTVVLPAIKVGFLALTGPIGAVVIAVAAAVAAIVMHWDKVKAVLVDSGAWTALKDLVGDSLNLITSFFGIFANALQGDWHNLWEHVKNTVKAAWNVITGVVDAGILGMGGSLAKGLSAIGLDSWSNAVQNKMNDVSLKMRTAKFILPPVTGGVSDLFKGFNFGGEGAGKGGSGSGGDGKGAKGKMAETVVDFIKRRISEIQKELEGMQISGDAFTKEGSERFAETLRLLDKYEDHLLRIESIQDRIKPLKLDAFKTLEPSKGAFEEALNPKSRETRLKKWAEGMRDRMKALLDFRAPNVTEKLQDEIKELQNLIEHFSYDGLAVPDFIQKKLDTAIAKLEKANIAVQKASISANRKAREAFFKAENEEGREHANSRPGMNVKLPGVKFRMYIEDNAQERLNKLGKDLTSAIQNAAAGSLTAFGEWVGGMAAGVNDLADLPKALGMVFADLAKQLGQSLIMFGAAAIAASALITNPFTAIAAGIALVALSAGLQASMSKSVGNVKGFAKGGVFDADSTIRVAEYANAASNKEIVTPEKLMSSVFRSELSNFQPQTAALPSDYSPSMRVDVNFGKPVVLPNGDLMFAIKKGERNSRTYGGGNS